jgi:hypothetical protein
VYGPTPTREPTGHIFVGATVTITYVRGRHPTSGQPQWEGRAGDKLIVLNEDKSQVIPIDTHRGVRNNTIVSKISRQLTKDGIVFSATGRHVVGRRRPKQRFPHHHRAHHAHR